MHPLVEEMWTKGKALGLGLNEMSDEAGVQRQSLKRWVDKGIIPKKTGLKKVKALIKKIDNGEIENPVSSEKQPPRQIIQEHWPEERKELYRLIYKVERKHGSFTDAPYEDADVSKLHNHLGIPRTSSSEDGNSFSKVKLEKLRREHNLTQRDMSKIAGRSRNWYNKFKSTKSFPEEHAISFAKYFEIDLDELLIDDYEE